MSAAAGIERVGEVSILRLRAEEGRFNPVSLGAIAAALDELEGSDAAGALVITGEGKIFSNGLDLEWMGAAPRGGAAELLQGVHPLLARLLVFPTATVAAINGHAFAAGAMLALAAGIVEAAVPSEQVLDTAVTRAAALAAKPRATVAAIKRGLYADAVAALEEPAALPDGPS